MGCWLCGNISEKEFGGLEAEVGVELSRLEPLLEGEWRLFQL